MVFSYQDDGETAMALKTMKDLKGLRIPHPEEHRWYTVPSPERPLFGVSREQALADRALYYSVLADLEKNNLKSNSNDS
jgi:hypothetical protein